MSSVIYGNSTWQNESEANNSGGWNLAGSIWGSTAADEFTFENNAFYQAFIGNGAVLLNGGGGADAVNFSSQTGGTFNLAQLLVTSGSYTVLGSTAGNDTFTWNGSRTLPTLNGGTGMNDVLTADSATAAVTINANSSTITGIEGFVGSIYNDTFQWNGLGSPTLNGGAGTADTLTFASATTALTVELNDAKITNFESFLGSSLSDKFSWDGVGSFTLNGGLGTDTLQLNGAAMTTYTLANEHLSSIDFIAGTSVNDNVVWSGADTFSFDLGTGNDTLNIGSATVGKEINLYDTRFKGIDVLSGSSLADTLRGTTNQETLIGGNGADILWGGEDTVADSLSGGLGADTYYWSRGFGSDTITDGGTASVIDTLVLSDVGLADMNIASTTSGIGVTRAISRVDNSNIKFDLYKDGVLSTLTMDLANDNAFYRQVQLTDTTFNLFVANDATGKSIAGTSLTDLIYGSQTEAYTFDGGAGADTLVGGLGNDTFKYYSGAKYYGQGNTADMITAATSTTAVELNLYDTAKFNGIEYAIGSSLADILRGASTSDYLLGGAGADILWGGDGAGFDTMQGGAGADTFWFSASQGNDVISVETDKSFSGSDVVKLSGVNFSDLTFSLGAANEAVLDFKASTGYTGRLTVDGFANVNQSYGASNANLYRVNTFIADDKTFGLALGTTTTTTLMGSSLDDYILGVSNDSGNVTVDGGVGADSIYGSGGNDYVKFDAADAIVGGGAGTDTLYLAAAGTMDVRDATIYTGFEWLQGSSGADVIRGSSANDTIMGAAGADNLWGYTGNDSLNGGAGADTYWFTTGDGKDSIVYDSANSASDMVQLSGMSFGSLSFAVASATGIVIGSGTDSLTLSSWIDSSATANLYRINNFVAADKTFGLAIGNDVATSLFGTALDDYFLAGTGNDILLAGAGADSLYGGLGNDLLKYSATAALYNGGNDTDTLSAASATAGVELNLYATNVLNIEYLEGSSLSDILRGSDASGETLNGGKGADHLYGGLGSDTMLGGAGADTYWFGTLDGADVIANDSGTTNNAGDVVNFYGLNFSDLAFSRINTDADLKITVKADQGYTDNVVLTNWGLDTNSNRVNKFVTSDLTFGLAIGTSAGESLIGTTLSDYIFAGAGADTINSLAGADTIYANDGDDSIFYTTTAALFDGGAGTDTLSASNSTASVEINLYDTKVVSIEYLQGSSLSDILRGSSLAETLSGGAGTDNLWGGAGADEMAGGNGIDTYWFGVGDGLDTITASTVNNTDFVKFYGGIDGNNIQSTVVSGNNLTITLTSGDALTLADWKLTDGSKLNNFDFGTAGVWALSVADDNVTATWTQRS